MQPVPRASCHFPNTSVRLVAMTASAGGVNALIQVVSDLPADLPEAVVIVQHLHPKRPSGLVDLLSRRASLPVQWAEPEELLRPGAIYLAPPDYHLLVN